MKKRSLGCTTGSPIGSIAPAEAHELAEHIASCPTCRDQLVEAILLSLDVKRAISSLPGAPKAAESVVLPGREVELARFDLGSFLIGLSVGMSVQGKRFPVKGDLHVFGRKLRLFKT